MNEWMNGTLSGITANSGLGGGWYDYSSLSSTYDYLKPYNTTFDHFGEKIGQFYSSAVNGNGYYRGGGYSFGSDLLGLYYGSYGTTTQVSSFGIGFRCVISQ